MDGAAEYANGDRFVWRKAYWSAFNVVGGLGAFFMLIAAALTFSDVVMRWLFASSLTAMNELVSLGLAVAIAACIPAGIANRTSLSIDLLERTLPSRQRNWFGVLGDALLLLFLCVLAWQILLHAGTLARADRVTVILHLPIAPFIFAVSGLIAVAAVAQVSVLKQSFDTALNARWSGREGSFLLGAVMLSATVVVFGCLLYTLSFFSDFTAWVRENSGMAVLAAFAAMWILLLVGVPMTAAVGLIGTLGTAAVIGWGPALTIAGTEPVGFLTNTQVATLPLFLLMGSFAAVAGLSEDLYRIAQAILGGLRGGLPMATVGGSAGFGAVTGSSVATAAIFGRVALPEMEKRNYSAALSSGAVAAGGTLGALIPPSSPLVLYALLTESSIGRLFIAAILPGILAVALYLLVIFFYVRIFPKSAPEPKPWDRHEALQSAKSCGPAFILFAAVIGGLYTGIFTATESASVGALIAFFTAAWRGKLDRKRFVAVMAGTSGTTAMIYGLIFGALIFSFFVGASAVPEQMMSFVGQLGMTPILTIVAILAMFVILGCIMDSFAVMIITIPIVVPIITGFGYDLIWWGIINLIVIEVGMITPPFGINIFVLKSVAPHVRLAHIFKGVLPFVLADVVKLALLVAFPAIALYLSSPIR